MSDKQTKTLNVDHEKHFSENLKKAAQLQAAEAKRKDDHQRDVQEQFERYINGSVYPSEMIMDSVTRINHSGIKDWELYSAMILAAMIENGSYTNDHCEAQAMGLKLALINRNLDANLFKNGANFDIQSFRPFISNDQNRILLGINGLSRAEKTVNKNLWLGLVTVIFAMGVLYVCFGS